MKVFDRGFWIAKHFYFQSFYHYFVNSAKFRSFTFFSVCNPAIDLGGMLYDRKTDIYDLIPKNIVPSTHIIKNKNEAFDFIESNNLSFPFIIKPNVGFKGFKVLKIENEEDLKAFFTFNDIEEREWLLQEFLDFKKEFSVLFYKYPTSNKYGITSFIEKTYPAVMGDGQTSLQVLIDDYKNSYLNREKVYKKFKDNLDSIPAVGQKIVLDEIGNYDKGSKFYNLENEIDDKMLSLMKDMFMDVDGLNFFRVDLKAHSVEDFKNNRFKVVEINGLKSEPLHIYDENSDIKSNHRTIKNHWEIIAGITNEQVKRAISLPTFSQGMKSLISIKKAVKE